MTKIRHLKLTTFNYSTPDSLKIIDWKQCKRQDLCQDSKVRHIYVCFLSKMLFNFIKLSYLNYELTKEKKKWRECSEYCSFN